MAAYNGRRGPNVSQFLQTLNTISPHDTTGDDNFTEDALALFTTGEFFDLDSGQSTNFHSQNVENVKPVSEDVTSATPTMNNVSNLDFGDFNFTEFSTSYPTPNLNAYPDVTPSFPQLQPNHGPVYPGQVAPQQQAHFAQDNARVGEKRKADASSSPQNLEDASRQSAEEDKRRRNTAASARFRHKKKQREQALEKNAKEMSDKVSSLESKVSQLETENKWLKNLLVEKNEGSEDIVALWKEFTKKAAAKSVKEER